MSSVKLFEVASIDLSGVDKKTTPNEKIVKLCNFTDVYYNWAITEQKESFFMIASANQKEIDRYTLKKGQVAITKDSETRDDIGVATYIADNFKDVLLGYHCALITPNPNKLSGKYLNALLHTPYAQKYFENQASGSGQRYTLTSEIIGNFPVIVITLYEQENIGNLFSIIDRKIELNNQLISELESLAKTIYDYWFLQFDFPDENGKPYKSSGGKMVWNEELKREIPDDFSIIKIGDIIDSSRGISYSTKDISGGGIPMLNLATFSVDSTYKGDGLKTFAGEYPKDKILHPYDLVMCNTQQTDLDPSKDIIGKSYLVPDIFDSDIVSSHHLTTIKTKTENMKHYLNGLFHTAFFHKYISGYVSGTSIMGLNFDGVTNYQIPIPPNKTLDKFANLSNIIEQKKSEILLENHELTSLRDFLLPMLMNGQIKIIN